MKLYLALFLVTTSITAGLNPLKLAHAAEVSAKVDSTCYPNPGQIVVPAGMSASGFQLNVLEAGYNCATKAPISERGFIIIDASGNSVFSYPDMSLPGLNLPAGQYSVFVNGGTGASAQLTYTLR